MNFLAEIFSIEIAAATGRRSWHRDVHVFEVSADGFQRGVLFLDLLARDGKRGGTWMTPLADYVRGDVRERSCIVVTNFEPASGKEAVSLDQIGRSFR